MENRPNVNFAANPCVGKYADGTPCQLHPTYWKNSKGTWTCYCEGVKRGPVKEGVNEKGFPIYNCEFPDIFKGHPKDANGDYEKIWYDIDPETKIATPNAKAKSFNGEKRKFSPPAVKSETALAAQTAIMKKLDAFLDKQGSS
jgi:hypothetical protein